MQGYLRQYHRLSAERRALSGSASPEGSPADPSAETLEFAGFPVPVRARVDASLVPLLGSALRGWRFCPPRDGTVEPHFALTREGGARAVTARGKWVGHPYTVSDPADVVCSFMAELLKAQANEATGSLCLHSAASVFAGRAVLFPATHRSGKSLLTAVLAARGRRVVGDDAVFLEAKSGHSVGSGLLPRVRLPWPDNLRPATRALCERRMPISGRRYGYLNPPDALMAANGEEAPIGAFVLLDRRPGARAMVEEAAKESVLKTLIWQNFARQGAASRMLDLLAELVRVRPTMLLTYGEAEEAADVLEATFSTWTDAATPPSIDDRSIRTFPQRVGEAGWKTKPGLTERRVGDVCFVADEDTGRIFHLNPTAAEIWRLLGDGADDATVLSLLGEAFPEVEPERIAQDVSKLAAGLRDSGLLVKDAGV